jgi:hypothetical protein
MPALQREIGILLRAPNPMKSKITCNELPNLSAQLGNEDDASLKQTITN